MVPNGWEYKKLGLVAELQRGFDLPSAKRINGSIPIISSGGLSGYHNESKVKAPGIVTGRYGSIGNVFYVEEDFWPLNTSLWVKNFHNNEPKYIYYLLTNFDFKKFSDKTGVPGVNRNDLHTVKVGVPPLQEQCKIAKILSTWDKAIATTEKLIDASKQQKKTLMQQLLTGKKRLIDPETGKAFEGDWKEVKVSALITKHSEKTVENKQYPVLTSSRKGIFFQSDYYNDRNVASEDTTGYNVVPRDYFTYRHMSDDLVFKFNRNTICDRGIVSTLYPVFSAKEEVVVPYLLQAILNEGSAFKRFSLSQKQGGSRTYMYLSKLNELTIQIPSINEQQKIASVLTAADKDIELLEAKLAHLKQEKKALMQQLLTGKRRVKVAETEAA
jgi:type I restriction enzyme S subunit